MSKLYESGRSLHDKFLSGINILADNVGSTLGPRGRNVIIMTEESSIPIITKDGVTVARHVDSDDPAEKAAIEIIRQAAIQTCEDAGDGTTTSTILSRAIFTKAQEYLAAGVAPVEIKRGIDKAVTEVVRYLENSATPIRSEEDIAHIATISANGDSAIGNLIARAVDLAGKDGAITVEEARAVETSLDVVEGFRFGSGWAASAFVTDDRRGTARYEDPMILVTDHKLSTIEEFMPVLELVARESKPLIVVADEIEGQLLAALIMNAMRGTLKVVAVKAPYYGEERRNLLSDIAVATGATFISKQSGIKFKDVKLKDFGKSKTAEISKKETCFVGGGGDTGDIEVKVDSLKAMIQMTDSLSQAESYQNRITRLSSGIAIIKVGGSTEPEMIERRDRIEDALEAAKAAQDSGVVAGGGVSLLRAVQNIDVPLDRPEQEYGVKIIKSCVEEPIRQMARNAEDSEDLILQEILRSDDPDVGWNFSTGEIQNLREAGVIDPVKVAAAALVNAASVAGTLLTTNNAVLHKKD